MRLMSIDCKTTAGVSSGAEPDDGDKAAVEPAAGATASSESRCPICLEDFEDKAFIDACFHAFCFACIVQWAQVTNSCPMCKTTFKSVIHNVRANDNYEQVDIQPKATPSHQEVSINEARRFRYRTTRLGGPRDQRHPLTRRRRESRKPAADERRRAVYSTGLKALPQCTAERRERVRNISASFFHENPASTHRLYPWLIREFRVLVGEENAEFMIQMVMSLIDKVDLESEEFASHLRPFLHARTSHFMHEFISFAKSPYDFIAYDNRVRYDWPENMLPPGPPQPRPLDTWDPEATQNLRATSSPGPSGLTSMQQRILDELATTRWDDSPPLLTTGSPISVHGSDSDSPVHDSGCTIVSGGDVHTVGGIALGNEQLQGAAPGSPSAVGSQHSPGHSGQAGGGQSLVRTASGGDVHTVGEIALGNEQLQGAAPGSPLAVGYQHSPGHSGLAGSEESVVRTGDVPTVGEIALGSEQLQGAAPGSPSAVGSQHSPGHSGQAGGEQSVVRTGDVHTVGEIALGNAQLQGAAPGSPLAVGSQHSPGHSGQAGGKQSLVRTAEGSGCQEVPLSDDSSGLHPPRSDSAVDTKIVSSSEVTSTTADALPMDTETSFPGNDAGVSNSSHATATTPRGAEQAEADVSEAGCGLPEDYPALALFPEHSDDEDIQPAPTVASLGGKGKAVEGRGGRSGKGKKGSRQDVERKEREGTHSEKHVSDSKDKGHRRQHKHHKHRHHRSSSNKRHRHKERREHLHSDSDSECDSRHGRHHCKHRHHRKRSAGRYHGDSWPSSDEEDSQRRNRERRHSHQGYKRRSSSPKSHRCSDHDNKRFYRSTLEVSSMQSESQAHRSKLYSDEVPPTPPKRESQAHRTKLYSEEVPPTPPRGESQAHRTKLYSDEVPPTPPRSESQQPKTRLYSGEVPPTPPRRLHSVVTVIPVKALEPSGSHPNSTPNSSHASSHPQSSASSHPQSSASISSLHRTKPKHSASRKRRNSHRQEKQHAAEVSESNKEHASVVTQLNEELAEVEGEIREKKQRLLKCLLHQEKLELLQKSLRCKDDRDTASTFDQQFFMSESDPAVIAETTSTDDIAAELDFLNQAIRNGKQAILQVALKLEERRQGGAEDSV